MSLPIIYSAHHASYNFGEFDERINLNLEQKMRFCDLGTDLTVPQNGLRTFVAQYSRGIVDLNRDDRHPDTIHPSLDFARPKQNLIWKVAMELTAEEKAKIRKEVYDAYHDEISKSITQHDANCLVVAWDNTANYVIGKNSAGADQFMMPIILSNQGDEGKVTGAATTCKPELLEDLGKALSQELSIRHLPSAIYYNLVFKGGNVARTHTNFSYPNSRYPKHSVQSLQIEYDMSITHDPVTLDLNERNARLLKEAFEVAVEKIIKYI